MRADKVASSTGIEVNPPPVFPARDINAGKSPLATGRITIMMRTPQ